MKVVGAAEMGRCESACGIASSRLMDNAAEALIRGLEKVSSISGKKVLVFTGKGNNGGDGYAVAHRLARRSPVKIFAVANEGLPPDAAANRAFAETSGAVFVDESGLEAALRDSDIVIDALLGTGITSAVREPVARCVEMINGERTRRAGLFVLAVDIPSGVSSDSGAVLGTAIRADATVTFGRPKRGLFLYPGALHAGEVVLDEIGMPESVFADLKGEVVERGEIAKLMPRRDPTAHKGKAKLLVVGGCAGMSGAVLMAAQAALKCDAGYVFVSMPDNVRDGAGVPIEAVRRPVPSRPGQYFGPRADSAILDSASEMHAVVAGGGFGRQSDERLLAARLIRHLPCPAVIDADILQITATGDYVYADAPRVLTPHPGEFSTLFGGSVEENEANRVEATVHAAARCRQVVVHKGRPTVVAAPDGRYAINTSGNERLATCGSGDVLAGVIGAFLARGLDAYDAARAGVYLHGMTVNGWDYPVGMTATEIIRLIPAAWRDVISG